MVKASVIILTKNRANVLRQAIESVVAQSFRNFELLVIDDGSTDNTAQVLQTYKQSHVKTIIHTHSLGITRSRQEGLEKATGKFIAFLDDDDTWIDPEKLRKQAEYLDAHPEAVLVGGGIVKISSTGKQIAAFRPERDGQIRRWMLLKNPFFTSTVVFRKQAAMDAGGFVADDIDLAEDYDLWLRMGALGKMYNFQEVFTAYAVPGYNRARFKLFLKKQLRLIVRHKSRYPNFLLSSIILRLRLFFQQF